MYEYDINNIEDFRAELKNNHNISKVQPAPFIKTTSGQTRAFILTFMQDHLPSAYTYLANKAIQWFINSTVSPSHAVTMKYGHPKKWCKQEEAVCKRCIESSHNADQCQNEELTCYHCRGVHVAGNRECARSIREKKSY